MPADPTTVCHDCLISNIQVRALQVFEQVAVELCLWIVLVVVNVLEIQTRMVSQKTLGDILELFLCGHRILLSEYVVLTCKLLHCMKENAFPMVVRHTDLPFGNV